MKRNRLPKNMRWNRLENKIEAPVAPRNGVSVSVGDVLPTLSKAFQNGNQWIQDFSDEQIQIPRDLMDLIQMVKKTER